MLTIYATRPGRRPEPVAAFPSTRRWDAETELEWLNGTRLPRELLDGVRYVLTVERAAVPLVGRIAI